MRYEPSAELSQDLLSKGVDIDRTLAVLALLETRGAEPPRTNPVLPDPNDGRIIDRTGAARMDISRSDLEQGISALGLGEHGNRFLEQLPTGLRCTLGEGELHRLGVLLYPKTAYGVLNGGSATTYIDLKKNKALSPEAYALLERDFSRMADASHDRPKGVSPAFALPDGRNGPSFLELKFRSLLIQALEYRVLTGDEKTPILPFFQMTSRATDEPLRRSYEAWRTGSFLAPLIERTGVDPTRALGAVQPLLAALTHSEVGLPRRIFDRANGKPDSALPLPGGHGENFRVLAETYRELSARGIRYVWLGNVDNSGYTIDPVSLALFALRGVQGNSSASFEFSWKTPIDTKGGILVGGATDRLTVADIGQTISATELAAEEAVGKKALFNCATGLFDLDWLIPNLPMIVDSLPIRVSDQDKAAGRYAQAEQTTWEVLGLIEHPLILAVAKESRFLAAKTLMETLLASPVSVRLDREPGAIPESLRKTAANLRRGFDALLESRFGYGKPGPGGERRPLSAAELEEAIAKKFRD